MEKFTALWFRELSILENQKCEIFDAYSLSFMHKLHNQLLSIHHHHTHWPIFENAYHITPKRIVGHQQWLVIFSTRGKKWATTRFSSKPKDWEWKTTYQSLSLLSAQKKFNNNIERVYVSVLRKHFPRVRWW